MIYLDNAATSFPKPPEVSRRMAEYLDRVGAPVNRSVYGPAQEVGLTVYHLRELLAGLFSFPESPRQVLLTSGATAALNQAICGTLRRGDHCLVSAMEHNAVMRPLQRLTDGGVTFDRIPCRPDGTLILETVEALIRPNTKLLVLCHASNVCGTVQDARAVGALCKRRGIFFLLDAAQTAGHYPVDFSDLQLSALALPAHKGLLGPPGIGALLAGRDFAAQMTPLLAGGTGSASDSEFLPDFLPDRFESGTPNLPGIYGWEAACEQILALGVDALRRREMALTARFLEKLTQIPGLSCYGVRDPQRQVGVFSVAFADRDSALLADELERRFGILTRCGLHCAPSAHKTLGTFPQGTVRFSLGHFTTEDEVDAACDALRQLAQG